MGNGYWNDVLRLVEEDETDLCIETAFSYPVVRVPPYALGVRPELDKRIQRYWMYLSLSGKDMEEKMDLLSIASMLGVERFVFKMEEDWKDIFYKNYGEAKA